MLIHKPKLSVSNHHNLWFIMTDVVKTIGLISDTHGLLRGSAVEALQGVDTIIHAGDIDNMAILDELELIAPVYAVRGNMDLKAEVASLPYYTVVKAAGVNIGAIHDRQHIQDKAAEDDLLAVIHGHTHNASVKESGGILYINPGSAGPKRSNRYATAAVLEIRNGRMIPKIITIG